LRRNCKINLIEILVSTLAHDIVVELQYKNKNKNLCYTLPAHKIMISCILIDKDMYIFKSI